jgi:hypothetical protein
VSLSWLKCGVRCSAGACHSVELVVWSARFGFSRCLRVQSGASSPRSRRLCTIHAHVGHVVSTSKPRGQNRFLHTSHSCDDHTKVQAETLTISSATSLCGGRHKSFLLLQLLGFPATDASRQCNSSILELEHGKHRLLSDTTALAGGYPGWCTCATCVHT